MDKLRVEIFYDDEARNWHFQVPALCVLGGGAASRAEVERQCVDAVGFALVDDSAGIRRNAHDDVAELLRLVDVTDSLAMIDVG